MSTQPNQSSQEIYYPEDDGNPMSDNTVQFEWITKIKGNLDLLFQNDPSVFVAGDLLWYPVEGHPEICAAPDTMVVIGRPKGHRRSYLQWREDGVAPQVAFEILSPSNRPGEMNLKREFYEQYGVQEYYVYGPVFPPDEAHLMEGRQPSLEIYVRKHDSLERVPTDDALDWTSPLLQTRFVLNGPSWEIFHPNGEPFFTVLELDEARQEAMRQQRIAQRLQRVAEQQRDEAEQQRKQAESQRQQAESQRQQAESQRDEERNRRLLLEEKLKELGVDPNELT